MTQLGELQAMLSEPPPEPPPEPSPCPAADPAADPALSGPRRPARLINRAGRVRLLRAVLTVLLVGGSIAGPAALLTGPARTAPAPTVVVGPEAGVAGFAELYVTAYLTAGEGSEQALTAYYPERVRLDGVTAGAVWVARTTTVETRRLGDQYWAVTVAADMLEAAGRGYQPAGVAYYAVGVWDDTGRYVATSLPAQIPAPAVGTLPARTVGLLTTPNPDDPLTGALRRFFAALLTGEGELARYAAAGSGLAAVSPPPYRTIELLAVGSARLPGSPPRLAVRAQVAGTTGSGRRALFDYAVEATQVSGRWEITRLGRAVHLTTRP